MKIEHSANDMKSVWNNGYAKDRLGNGAKSAENGTVKNGSINAAGLNFFDDEIANRKQKAMQDAMQYIRNQFQADGEIDEVMEICRENTAKSQDKLKEANDTLDTLEKEKEQMLEACGGEETEEYKAYLADYKKERESWVERKENAEKDIVLQTGIIRGVKQEILKHHGMDDAQKAQEMMLEASSKEVTGMLMEEAKEKIDEMVEDAVEKGEEKKEETEEMESRLEEIQAELRKKVKEIEDKLEEARKNNSTGGGSSYTALDLGRVHEEIARHNNEVLKSQNLLPEDIKGAVIDDIF